jgi:hypothetical protein
MHRFHPPSYVEDPGWAVPTGGVYAFAPSLAALEHIGAVSG